MREIFWLSWIYNSISDRCIVIFPRSTFIIASVVQWSLINSAFSRLDEDTRALVVNVYKLKIYCQTNKKVEELFWEESVDFFAVLGKIIW